MSLALQESPEGHGVPSLTHSNITTPDSDYLVLLNDLPEPLKDPVGHKAVRRLPSPPKARYTPAISIVQLASHGAPITILAEPGVLSRFLDYVTWDEFYALSRCSREIRRRLWKAPANEVVMARFAPGFATAIRHRDYRNWNSSIRMSFGDLIRLMVSLETPLHRYPMHALSILSSAKLTMQQERSIRRFQILTLAHSRFVLVLQSMVHSSSSPVQSEIEDVPWRNAMAQAGLRELKFPAPLSYFGPQALSEREKLKPKKLLRPGSSQSADSSVKSWQTSNGKPRASLDERKLRSTLHQHQRRTSRLSVFGVGSTRVPPPPPLTQPASLRFYSGSWRRAVQTSHSDDEDILRPPQRRFLSVNLSSNSSIDSAPTQSSRTASTPSSTSPHDLHMATSRVRAPIIRVFVPCTTLSEDTIAACEEQLVDRRLWEHLSAGDIVCNLGYVPSLNESDDFGVRRLDPGQEREDDHCRWLIFTGERLVVFDPTTAPPVADALSLPSPFYYSHILPPFSDTIFKFTLPTLKAYFTLVHLTTTLVSPMSQAGQVRVKKYAWIATAATHYHPLMGDGWRAEWVLQGEGTPEGKLALLEAMRGGPKAECVWEIVKEKSGGGKLWLRLVVPPSHAIDRHGRRSHVIQSL